MNKFEKSDYLELLLKVFVLVAIFLVLFFNGRGIELVSYWFTKIFISLVYSIIAGALVGTFTANFFEQEIFKYPILGVKFNIPVVVLTFIVKILLF